MRLCKFVILLLIGGIVALYVIHTKDANDEITSIGELSTSGDAITFRRKINGNLLTIHARRAEVCTADTVRLRNVQASFEKANGEMIMECEECTFNIKEKKAYLTKNVQLKSADIRCCTESVVVNFVKNSITGNSQIRGTKTGMQFVSSGFHVRPDGNIILTHAKMMKSKR
ncbi:MAG: hypothetical protein LBR78_00895 [Holosporales bacterium]|nr:hypothetical protein [Holosporales bacterium]